MTAFFVLGYSFSFNSFASAIHPGLIRGRYQSGCWFWLRHHVFQLTITSSGKNGRGKLAFEHEFLGSCTGDYVAEKNEEYGNDTIIIYSANLQCLQVKKTYYVVQFTVPDFSLDPRSKRKQFSSQLLIRSVRDNQVLATRAELVYSPMPSSTTVQPAISIATGRRG